MVDCTFCKIIAGDMPGEILFKDDNVMVLKDINPQGPFHLLLIPIKHIESILDLTTEDKDTMAELMYRAKLIAEEQGIAENGFRLVINTGRHARQEIYHIHVHLIAGRRMTWPPG